MNLSALGALLVPKAAPTVAGTGQASEAPAFGQALAAVLGMTSLRPEVVVAPQATPKPVRQDAVPMPADEGSDMPVSMSGVIEVDAPVASREPTDSSHAREAGLQPNATVLQLRQSVWVLVGHSEPSRRFSVLPHAASARATEAVQATPARVHPSADLAPPVPAGPPPVLSTAHRAVPAIPATPAVPPTASAPTIRAIRATPATPAARIVPTTDPRSFEDATPVPQDVLNSTPDIAVRPDASHPESAVESSDAAAAADAQDAGTVALQKSPEPATALPAAAVASPVQVIVPPVVPQAAATPRPMVAIDVASPTADAVPEAVAPARTRRREGMRPPKHDTQAGASQVAQVLPTDHGPPPELPLVLPARTASDVSAQAEPGVRDDVATSRNDLVEASPLRVPAGSTSRTAAAAGHASRPITDMLQAQRETAEGEQGPEMRIPLETAAPEVAPSPTEVSTPSAPLDRRAAVEVATPSPLEWQPRQAEPGAPRPTPASHVTIPLETELGSGSVRVAVRGDAVHTTFVAHDNRLHDDLARRSTELHRSLEEVGFGEARVQVRVAEPGNAASTGGDARGRQQDEGRESARSRWEAERDQGAFRRERDRDNQHPSRRPRWPEEEAP